MKNVTVQQKEKGTDIIKLHAVMTEMPESLEELITLIDGHDDDRFGDFVMQALTEYGRGKCLGRLAQLDRTNSELFDTITFADVMTTAVRKLTAASMVTKMQEEVAKLAAEMSAAVDSEDFALCGEINVKLKEAKATMESWEVKRETERKAKAVTRAANTAAKDLDPGQ